MELGKEVILPGAVPSGFLWQITDASESRYEVPREIIQSNNETANTSSLSYHIEFTKKPFSIKVMRMSNKRVLWAFYHSLYIFEYKVPVSLILTYFRYAISMI